MKLAVAVTPGDVSRCPSTTVSCHQGLLGSGTLQQKAGNTPKSMTGSKVEKGWDL